MEDNDEQCNESTDKIKKPIIRDNPLDAKTPAKTENIEGPNEKVKQAVVTTHDTISEEVIHESTITKETIDSIKKDNTTDIDSGITGEKEVDVSGFITLITGSDEEVDTAIDKADKELDDDEAKETLKNKDEYITKLISTSRDIKTNKQLKLASELLIQLNKQSKKLIKATGKLTDKINKGIKYSKSSGTHKVTGGEAKYAILARLKGIKRVNLYNSGFHIDIRPLELAELAEFYGSVDQEANELGKLLGGHMCLFDDLFIKCCIIELLPNIVVGSNLKGYDKGTNLIKAISYHDYDTIVWAISSLLYRDGMSIDLICPNDKCKTITKNVKVDINALRLNVFENVSEEALEFITVSDLVTMDELKEYRLTKFKLTKTGSLLLNDINIEYTFECPSLYDWMKEGKSLLSGMSKILDYDMDITNDKVRNQYIINIHRMFKPWIIKVEFFNDDGSSDFYTEDRKGILELLDISQQEASPLKDKLIDYIADTKISHFCYSGIHCPKCNHVPADSINDYTPIDMQSVFFYLTCQRLATAGMN